LNDLCVSKKSRAVGAVIGLAVGDAVGTTVEFRPRGSFAPLTDMVGGGPFGLEPGQWTDDTSMALCLAESLLANQGLNERDLMDRFVRWWRQGENSSTGRCFDIGNATREALARYERTGDPLAGNSDPQSAGNGSLMRLSPVAVFFHARPEAAKEIARRHSATTHAAPTAIDACAYFAELIVGAIRGDSKEEVLASRDTSSEPEIAAIAAGMWRAKDREEIRSSGYVVHTLEAAIWTVDRTRSFEEAVLTAANLGDDADTVAAVTGQLAGALYGSDAIPEKWRTRLAWSDRIEALSAELFAAGRGL